MKMKKRTSLKFILPLLLLCFQVVFPQDYSNVDSIVKTYPTGFSNPGQLAKKIQADFTSETEKTRAIYTWIASNIHYDMSLYRANMGQRQVAFSYRTEEEKEQKMKKFNSDLAQKTLRSHKGVCQGYTALFDAVAKELGIESVMIPGTSKSHPTHIGKLPVAADHIWNAVKIGGKWKFIDATWASGGVDSGTGKFINKFSGSYFFTDPDAFFLNHFPDDDKWLLTDKTAEDFASLPLFYPTYLEADYTVSFPKSGVLPVGYIVPFKIDNLKTDKIAYVLSSEREFHPVIPTQNGNVTEFEVPIAKNAVGFLTIYIGHDSVVTYKIGRS
jgi:hypothetical protein